MCLVLDMDALLRDIRDNPEFPEKHPDIWAIVQDEDSFTGGMIREITGKELEDGEKEVSG